MIVAAGLSPAWQQIMRFDAVRPGEVNRAIETCWCASGKVLNVGVALARLGGPSLTLSAVGAVPGESIRREFASLGVPARWITCKSPTRICTTVLDAATGGTTELVENAGPLEPEEIDAFRDAFLEEAAAADLVIVAGSLPDGAPAGLVKDLLRQTSARPVLDIRGPELLEALAARPLVVKPNREELALTVGRPLDSDAELHRAMRELNDRGAQWVVITQGKHPMWVAERGGAMHRVHSLDVEVVNPIGSGDCLAAAIAWGIRAGRNPLDAIRLGVAAAADNVSRLLPGRIDADRVMELADRVRVDTF